MPAHVEPCLALLKPRPPIGQDWTYEVKWDGYRIALHLNNGNVRILTARKQCPLASRPSCCLGNESAIHFLRGS
ncbi:DNA ligase (ATP) [Rhizobium favelukesii]|uniref:DNA ligase (ATP) n=1 Tax=Rhizobium favelukesii TaxID=348824 RepID=W6RA68_9HYPH|nr:DNA ligase (ATP) [Rhizobium favelukesii]